MLGFLSRHKERPSELLTSQLFNEETFYPIFMKDVNNYGSELIIECPFVTSRRLNQLLPTLQKLKERKVRIVINTRNPSEHDEGCHQDEAYRATASL